MVIADKVEKGLPRRMTREMRCGIYSDSSGTHLQIAISSPPPLPSDEQGYGQEWRMSPLSQTRLQTCQRLTTLYFDNLPFSAWQSAELWLVAEPRRVAVGRSVNVYNNQNKGRTTTEQKNYRAVLSVKLFWLKVGRNPTAPKSCFMISLRAASGGRQPAIKWHYRKLTRITDFRLLTGRIWFLNQENHISTNTNVYLKSLLKFSDGNEINCHGE